MHAIPRGIDRPSICFAEADYAVFLDDLETFGVSKSVRVHAAVLMTGRVHLLMKAEEVLVQTSNRLAGMAGRELVGDGDRGDPGQRHAAALRRFHSAPRPEFLLTAWLAYLWRWRHRASALGALLIVAGAAWVTTLAANAAHILFAVHGQDALARLGGLTRSDSHRLVGICVCFLFLCLWLVVSGPGRLCLVRMVATVRHPGANLILPAPRAWP